MDTPGDHSSAKRSRKLTKVLFANNYNVKYRANITGEPNGPLDNESFWSCGSGNMTYECIHV